MANMNTPYFAHSANAAGEWHLLRTHLRSVATLAREFADKTIWADEVYLAGLLHDLGKYADRFQARLRGEDAGLDHWSQGAWIALTKHRAKAAALAIEGHHIGLQRGSAAGLRGLNPALLQVHHPLRLSLSNPDPALLERRAMADALCFDPPSATAFPEVGMKTVVASMLDIRLLFSCLVDADFLDTEAHFNGDEHGKCPRLEGPLLDVPAALAALDRYMAERVRCTAQADSVVLDARERLWQAVGEAAEDGLGLFTLTAPTGSGKTLAMLRFALQHANKNALKRIVLAVPFLTVIEQTARTYRDVFAGFPENFVLEHHSLAGLGEESERRDAEGAQERRRRSLAENWDAPIILTTNVQLLESLFSNRPSSCRKLHHLMESVILFDEAQSLPQHLAVPTLAALSHLSGATYRTSVVFATATQPAFEALDAEVSKQALSGWRPSEAAGLFAALKRVNVTWPEPGEKLNWSELARRVRETPQVLVVCNLKRHALGLLKELNSDEDVFHLSTNLCAEHRRAVLKIVRERLQAGLNCRLISTQCVEAGVDVDFPVVYRAFAPLEAITQAAGRCNREGRLNQIGRLGEVIVFEPAEDGDWRRSYPTRAYFQAAQVTRSLLVQTGDLDIGSADTFNRYYRALYNVTDPASQSPELTQALRAMDFVEVAKHYRLIERGTIQVLVPWAPTPENGSQFVALRDEAEVKGITAQWMRRAQGLAVSVYHDAIAPPAWAIPARLRWNGKDAGVSDEWFILEGDYYDDTIGLNPPDGPRVFIA